LKDYAANKIVKPFDLYIESQKHWNCTAERNSIVNNSAPTINNLRSRKNQPSLTNF